jgi:hypothetical protein
MAHLASGHGGLADAPPWSSGLAQLAPEIADRLAAAWGSVRMTSRLLEELLVSDSIASLSSAVTRELLRMYEYHARCRAGNAPDAAWELPASQSQSPWPVGAVQASRP